jgi:RNA polymerase sigma factor (sigma-70 family)
MATPPTRSNSVAPDASAILTRQDIRFPKGLTKQDRKDLSRILHKPYDFMGDERFYEPGAEEAILGGETIDRPNCGWYAQLAYDPRDTPRELKPQALPLLTPAQEKVAFLRFNYCRFRVEQLRQKTNPKRLSPKRAEQLLHWHRLARHFREMIAEYNLGLVLAMARRLPTGQVDLPEMISEGNMALLRGIDKFNVSKGFKFSTYACRAILKAFSRQGMKNTRQKSLFPVGFEPDLERSNYQEEKNADEEQSCASEVRRIVETNSANLSKLELDIIDKRFRFKNPDEAGLTLQQVGKLVGLTKERVRQIQITAMDKIRQTLETQYLNGPSIADRLSQSNDREHKYDFIASA